LYSYSLAHHHAVHDVSMCVFLFALLMRFDKKLFYWFFSTVISQRTAKMLQLQV